MFSLTATLHLYNMADKRWKATTAALLSPIFWLQGHIPNQKSLWELFTQDGTDQPHWLMDYLRYFELVIDALAEILWRYSNFKIYRTLWPADVIDDGGGGGGGDDDNDDDDDDDDDNKDTNNDNNNSNNDENNDNDNCDNNNDDINNKFPVDSPHKGPIMLSFDVTFGEYKNNNFRWFETPCPSCNVTVMWYIYATPTYLYCWKLVWMN